MSNDEWSTPQWLFDELNEEFGFSLDVCATQYNSKCYLCCYKENSCFDRSWKGNICFMNPPYSNPFPFVKKAWEESKECLVVCILKVDPSTKWWGIFWDYELHQEKPGCLVRFLPKRVKFDPPEGWEGGLSGPSFATAIVIMDRRKK